MARILYIGVPAFGHSYPALPVLNELSNRGHQVIAYNHISFRVLFENADVEFIDYPAVFPEVDEIRKIFSRMISTSVLISRIAEPLIKFLSAQINDVRPDLIIYDSMAAWGYISARTCSIDNVCFNTTFVMKGSEKAMGFFTMLSLVRESLPVAVQMKAWISEMKDRYGSDVAGGITEFAQTNIVFTSRELQPESKYLNDRFFFVGASINPDLRSEADLSLKVLNRNKPLVYISMGTILKTNKELYVSILETARRIDAEFIISTGGHSTSLWNTLEGTGIPENLHVFQSVPQLQVLQYADVFISHGGMNSLSEALIYGVPIIAIPGHQEQILNGKRLQFSWGDFPFE